MKSKPIALLILMSTACLLGMHEDIHAQPQAAKRAIKETDLFDFVWIGDPQISPDGSQVVFYRVVPNQQHTDYDGAIWMVPTSGNSSPAELITGKNVSNARWSPDGQSLIYRRDGQLTLFSLRTKESRTLTSLPGGAGGAVWSPDGRRVAFLSSTPDEQTASEASLNASDHKSDVHVITEANYHTGGRGYLNHTLTFFSNSLELS